MLSDSADRGGDELEITQDMKPGIKAYPLKSKRKMIYG